jgi:hypothetical protein
LPAVTSEQWAEHRRRCDEEERRQRVMVITQFGAEDPEATMHAMADEILKYRRALRLLVEAVGWADAGAPFSLISSGPYWHPLGAPLIVRLKCPTLRQRRRAPTDDKGNLTPQEFFRRKRLDRRFVGAQTLNHRKAKLERSGGDVR